MHTHRVEMCTHIHGGRDAQIHEGGMCTWGETDAHAYIDRHRHTMRDARTVRDTWTHSGRDAHILTHGGVVNTQEKRHTGRKMHIHKEKHRETCAHTQMEVHTERCTHTGR